MALLRRALHRSESTSDLAAELTAALNMDAVDLAEEVALLALAGKQASDVGTRSIEAKPQSPNSSSSHAPSPDLSEPQKDVQPRRCLKRTPVEMYEQGLPSGKRACLAVESRVRGGQALLNLLTAPPD